MPPQFLVIKDGSPSLPAILRRMQAVDEIGALAVFWRCDTGLWHVLNSMQPSCC